MRQIIFCLYIALLSTTLSAQKPANIRMVAVQGGTFKMGCTMNQYSCNKDEKPVHQVSVNNFMISKFEITNAQYCAFLNDIEANPGGSYYGYEYINIGAEECKINYADEKFYVKKGMKAHPVVEVSWYGAKAFCHWADGRLPTEAEWEYAARGGAGQSSYIYSGGDTLKQVGWFKSNYYTTNGSNEFTYREGPLPVGQKAPNSLGIYDMSGNVWELCNDWYGENYYAASPRKNPKGPKHSNYRVKRGGSFKEEAQKCRLSARYKILPGYSKADVGFRLCRSTANTELSNK